MKRAIYFILVLSTIIFLSSCTIHFPYDYDISPKGIKILFKVVPEDAALLLNGKMIGEVYEFSSWESALKLSSKNNEVVIKKEGYTEEPVDLYSYSGREFVVRMNLNRDPAYRSDNRRDVRKRELDGSDSGVAVKPREMDQPEIKADEDNMIVHKTALSLNVTPSDAAIYINKKFWGISPGSGVINNIVLKTGRYLLEITKPGYRTYKKKIVVAGKMKNLELKVQLKKK